MLNRPPILYCLQYHPASKPQAMALAKLIADIEKVPQYKMAFMFCPRFDTLVDTNVEMAVREKFPDTRIYQCKNRQTGWPRGPNAMVHEIYAMFAAKCNSGRPEAWNYGAIFFGEPDCVPLSTDWIEKIWTEWYECDWNWPGGNRQLALGHWLVGYGNDSRIPHINGNCLLSPALITAYPAFRVTMAGAWDTTHAKGILAHARPSKMIFSDYNVGGSDGSKPFLGCESLFRKRVLDGPYPIENEETQPVYLHGIKDPRAIECVRQVLGVEDEDRSKRRFSA